MKMLRPYGTLAVGIAIGMFVLPKVLSKANISLPSM